MASSGVGSAYMDRFEWNYATYEELLKINVMGDLVKRAILVQHMAVSIRGQEAPPSSPGQPPAVRTGTLRRSIAWKPGLDGISPYVDVGSNVLYAPYVELGTSRMAPRPFLKPALEAARATF